ncbi:MAG: Coenzyme F420 hydrogenase/dehydrogenase, beta subunit C-terminal domain [Methanobacteriaceae archaeon]|nr:Coenzyme F420 hydrogenase/dehydrogenase, beta subunit C-terminal domain [Methanobacteriaceae archaeon]
MKNLNINIGSYEEIIAMKAKDKKIQKKAQSGGCVTALLIYALEKDIIDGAVLTATINREKTLQTEPIIATTKKEILKAAKSKFTVCPTISVLKEATRKYGLEKIGTVNLPCQVRGIRKMQSYPLATRFIKKNIALILGIFCTATLSNDAFDTLIKEKAKVKPIEVTKISILEKELRISTDEKDIYIPSEQVIGYQQSGCDVCKDYTSKYSDISMGNVGSPDGWSTVIKRTSKGSKILEAAINDDIFEVEPITDGFNIIEKHAKIKKELNQKNIDKKLELGLTIPYIE